MITKQQAWEELIRVRKIDLSKEVNFITADEIKSITKQEPRIMAKFDSSEELPQSFKRYGVFLLPLKNKEYAIVRGTGYHNLEKIMSRDKIFRSRLPFGLVSHTQGVSEMQHIDYAYNSGLVEEFAGCGNLFLTIRGRKYSPAFEFKVDGSPKLRAQSVQIEVDAGLEGQSDIVIIEGKIKTPKDFIIRQLFYPYRFWQTVVPDKKTQPIFFTFDPTMKVYNFWKYSFHDIEDYESIELAKSAAYRIHASTEATFKAEDFAELRGKSKKKVIVPQADDVKKILEFPFRIAEGMTKAGEISRYFEFDSRQSSYYREASEALGFVELKSGKYYLTDIGRTFIRLPVQERNELLARLMFELPVMHEVLMELLIKPSKQISREEIIRIIESNSHLTGSTLLRRAQTVLAWFRWVQNSVGILTVTSKGLAISSGQTVS